jgi:hypothetical protein
MVRNHRQQPRKMRLLHSIITRSSITAAVLVAMSSTGEAAWIVVGFPVRFGYGSPQRAS